MFFFILSVVFSQEMTKFEVTESVRYKDDIVADKILSIHTSEAGKTSVIRVGKKHFVWNVFDENLNRTFSKAIERSKKELYIEDIFYKDEVKLFSVYASKKEIRILYCYVFNLVDNSYKKVKLFETTVAKKQGLFSGGNKRRTSIAVSPNGKYFVIVTDDIRKNINSYTARVYNSKTLEIVYVKKYQEHENHFFEPNDLLIDNEAVVYSLGKSFLNGKSQKKEEKANYRFVLNKISEEKTENLEIQLEKEHIESLSIVRMMDKMSIIGFYSEKEIASIKGVCNFIVDAKKFNIISKSMSKLPKEVYDGLYDEEKSKRKQEKELYNFNINHVLQDENGSTFLIAEESYITSTYVPGGMNGGGHTTTTAHYDDIIILKFDNSGKLDWGRSIFKKATFPSYNAFLKNGELHIILNSGKNLTEKSNGRTKVSKNFFESSTLYDFVYSVDGEKAYRKIQDNKDKSYYQPYYGTFANNTFIMISRGASKQFMMLK